MNKVPESTVRMLTRLNFSGVVAGSELVGEKLKRERGMRECAMNSHALVGEFTL